MPVGLEPLDVAVQIPSYFRCPISLELMSDPVTVCTGQTYDRSSIESWVATGNTTCPVTRVLLTDFTLIPNHTLRRLIQDWCVANRNFGVERIPTPKQPAEPDLVRSLLNQASSGTALFGVRVSALRKLGGLARDSEKNRVVIAAGEAREVLLYLVFANVGPDSSDLSHESLAVLSMFTLSEAECTYVATDLSRVGYLVNLLFHSSVEVRVNSASVIENVVAGVRSPDLRSQISSSGEVFEGVISVLTHPRAYPRAFKIGIKALFALCLVKQHRHNAVAAGAVDVLVDKLAVLEKCDAERALATVELLCRVPSGCAAFSAHETAVQLLVKIILKISGRATEYATGALLSLCSASEKAQNDAVACGILAQMVLLVQSDCTARAKRKAQMLLKLLRDSWPDDSIANSDTFPGSDVAQL
ncbi:U-box domain-containing protein 26-like [Dorcoceras hygrometricum]|uniref:U-box domain-containing protein n=1 Tax=Dorcoceras hygrometricum TaxID=472368 RepID=A0A2Z7B4R4_9LAMI|nr:U-box domain-containing protein 26-like [Dorcoceras hygrometricum]